MAILAIIPYQNEASRRELLTAVVLYDIRKNEAQGKAYFVQTGK